ncbi:hypothetical protein NO1_0632 [Candidatus Termititenax aidoneus]|uniref:Uncharacterized protein n=1 Tax=Termititenax aidoneus TaxID=2218524 RepID=A0A388TAB1_TERA1|nr:hypothetical protein NO1_0632 [Candidatus Termititenax aidoneus]
MKKTVLFGILLGALLAAEFSAEAVTTIESPLLGRQTLTQNITEWPRPEKIYQDKLFTEFNLQTAETPAGLQMTGAPKDPDSSFSRLFIQLDQNKNLSELRLYNRAEQEVLSLKNTYEERDGVFLPARAEVFLSESKLRAVTEYRNVQFNGEIK